MAGSSRSNPGREAEERGGITFLGVIYLSRGGRRARRKCDRLHTAKLMIEGDVQGNKKLGNGYDSIHRGETVDSPSSRV